MHDGSLRAGNRQAERVDEQVVRLRRELPHGTQHGLLGRLIDIDAVDGRGLDLADGSPEGAAADHGRQALAVRGFQLFGVAQARRHQRGAIQGQHHGRRDHGPKKRAAADFIDPRDPASAAFAGGTLKCVIASEKPKHTLLQGLLRDRGSDGQRS